MSKKKLTFCLLLFFSIAARAQTLPLVNYSIQNGLPESTVYAIYLDQQGYLWAGTQGGVSLFDGLQFRTYDSQVGLPDNHVTAISGTPDRKIWFGHRSGQLSYYINGKIKLFKHKDYHNTTEVNHLLCFDKRLWISTAADGLWMIDFSGKAAKINHINTEKGLAGNTINEVCADNKGQIWAATNNGLTLIAAGRQTVVKQTFPASLRTNIRALSADGTALLVATPGGLFRYARGVATLYTNNRAVTDACKTANAIRKDSKGNVWLAYNEGVIRINRNGIKAFTKKNGLLSRTVYEVLEDREHGIWMAQYDGISCLKDSPFELYDSKDGLVYNETYAIEQEADRRLWVGTAQGISIFSQTGDSLKHIRNISQKDGLPDNFVYDIHRDSRNNIWVACVNNGAACYLSAKHKVLAFGQAQGLAGKEVCSINEDKKGRIWLATLDSGVAVFNQATNKFKSYTRANGFLARGVWTIHRDRSGDLWFGTRKQGLLKLDVSADTFIRVKDQQKLVNHDFGSVSSDSKGNIWIATIGDAVYRYTNGRFLQYGSRNGIKSNNPYFIHADFNDNIWIGTNIGLDHFNPKTQTTVSYLKNDGFMGIETNQNAVAQFDSANIWIGTMNGLMRYRTGNKFNVIPPPQVYITGRQLFFNKENVAKEKLNHNQNYITFSYLGLSLGNATKVRYRYKLQGLSQEWSPPLADNRVSYASLAPGKYTFMVMAGYLGGNWSRPVTYSFEIVPPFYRTWWFIALIAVIIYLTGSWLYRYRVNQLLQLEKMRNKIASDLHDDIGSALSSISIFSEVADKQLQQQAPPERTREVLGHISHHSRAMLDAMDDIVWAVNPRNDHFNDLEVRMREFAIPLLEARDIKFNMQTGAGLQDTRLSMEGRKNIYLIFKECINNVLKHAGANTVTVTIAKQNNQLDFVIADDGKGFDPTASTNRNGLKNLEKRAAEINGTVKVKSNIGKGTKVSVTINII